jgi:cobalt-zinc-cadmium resistance protein CzcA
VQIDPRTDQVRLSFKEVMEALAANNKQVGGSTSTSASRAVPGARPGAGEQHHADIGNIVIAEREGAPIYVRDVAEVKEAPALRFGAVTRDGKEVVLGIALARINENAQERRRCGEGESSPSRRPRCPRASASSRSTTAPRWSTRRSKTAESALIEGSILVAVILFLFLGEIPLGHGRDRHLAAGDAVRLHLMQQFGLSANLMSLAGLAIGIGMMVDGAVVMVENAFRCSRISDGSRSSTARTSCWKRRARWPTRSLSPSSSSSWCSCRCSR